MSKTIFQTIAYLHINAKNKRYNITKTPYSERHNFFHSLTTYNESDNDYKVYKKENIFLILKNTTSQSNQNRLTYYFFNPQHPDLLLLTPTIRGINANHNPFFDDKQITPEYLLNWVDITNDPPHIHFKAT